MSITKSFTDYVKDSEREYSYRIKTVAHLSDTDMEYMELVLDKYVLREISKPVKTILQRNPLDFPDIRNAEVWIIDVTTALPASAYVLQQELKLALKLPEKYIVVRSENDPLEIYTQQMDADNEMNMIAMEKGLEPSARLSTNREYDEDERGDLEHPLYGDEYNSSFLDTLAQVAATRVEFNANPDSEELNQGGTVADPDIEADDGTFNNDIEGAPRPKDIGSYTNTIKNYRKAQKNADPRLSTESNYDDDEIKRSKKYNKYGKDEKVATVTITNKREGIRK